MDESEKPLTMKLAEEGVDEPVAYEAAAEAEKQRLEAERERLQAKSFGQAFVEQTDMAQLIEVVMETTMKAVVAGQGVQQRQQQPAVSVERRPEPGATQEASEDAAAAPEQSPLAEQADLNDEQ